MCRTMPTIKSVPLPTHEQQVSWRHYPKLVEETPVKVVYLPVKPRISRLAASDRDNTVRDSGTIIAAIACVVFLPLVVLWLLTYLIEPAIIQKRYR